MWGLWLVTEAQHQQAAGWPANGWLQSHTKSGFFFQKPSANIQLLHSSRQANPSSAPHHQKAHRRQYHVLKGSAQLTTGDVGGDTEAQDQFSLKSVNPEREGALSSLSQKSGHRKTEGVTGDRGTKKEIILCSELLLCQGHRTLLGCYRHQTLHIVHGALNFI